MCIRDRYTRNCDTNELTLIEDECQEDCQFPLNPFDPYLGCLLYTSDAADDLLCVDLGGRRIIKKKESHIHSKQSNMKTITRQ